MSGDRAMSGEPSTSRSPAKQTSDRSHTQGPNITITAISQVNRRQIISYTMRNNGRLGGLMTTYCNRFHMDLDTTVFLYDGRRINKEQTPAELGIENGDEIDVMQHMTGGGGGFILLN